MSENFEHFAHFQKCFFTSKKNIETKKQYVQKIQKKYHKQLQHKEKYDPELNILTMDSKNNTYMEQELKDQFPCIYTLEVVLFHVVIEIVKNSFFDEVKIFLCFKMAM